MKIDRTVKIGEIVAFHYATAAVFTDAGIDFCCGGDQPLEEVCRAKGLDVDMIGQRLNEAISQPVDPSRNFREWDAVFLCDYIINVHHSFVRTSLPELLFYTRKIAEVHGPGHSELIEIADLFQQLGEELTAHLSREEQILFPVIKGLAGSQRQQSASDVPGELNGLKDEHDRAGSAMDMIRQLSGDYLVPADACNTYRVAYEGLRRFEEDLHLHVHLENNILFPKAMKMIDA